VDYSEPADRMVSAVHYGVRTPVRRLRDLGREPGRPVGRGGLQM